MRLSCAVMVALVTWLSGVSGAAGDVTTSSERQVTPRYRVIIVHPVQNEREPRYYMHRQDPWRFRLDSPEFDRGWYRYQPYRQGFNWRYRYDPQYRRDLWRYRYDPRWRYQWWDDRLNPSWRYDPYYRLDRFRYDPRIYDPRLERFYEEYYYEQGPLEGGALDDDLSTTPFYYIPPYHGGRALDDDLRVR